MVKLTYVGNLRRSMDYHLMHYSWKILSGCESEVKEDSGALEDDSDLDNIVLIKTIVTELTMWPHKL